MIRLSLLALGMMAGLGGERAAAQSAQPAAPAAQPAAAVPAVPQSTSATFGDWVLNCQRVGEAAAQKKLCEVTQTLAAKGQTAPLARIALGRLNAGEPLRLTVVIPVNITPATAPRLLVGDKPAGATTLAWQRCVPVGCFAFAMMDEAAVTRVKTASDQSRITFHDGQDREAALPLSSRGLSQALDALTKEDTAK